MKNDPKIKTQDQSEKFTHTPQNVSEMMLTTNDDIIQSIPPDDEFSEWDVTLMDGLEDEPPYYVEDEFDNISGDLILF